MSGGTEPHNPTYGIRREWLTPRPFPNTQKAGGTAQPLWPLVGIRAAKAQSVQ